MNAARPLAVAAIAVMLLPLARAAGTVTGTGTGTGAGDGDVATLAAWWPGIYDNAEQLVFSREPDPARIEGSQLRVRTLVSQVSLPWLGDTVLYLEEFLHDDPEWPRRHVLLRLEPNGVGGGVVRVRQYTLREPARFRHLHRSPRLIASLRVDDLASNPGCDLVLRREVKQFTGGTEGNACRDDTGEVARYVDYRLLVGQDLYWYRLRRYRVADNELEEELAGYTWFQLYQARLFSCRVRWSATGRAADLRELVRLDVHDQGGRARFGTPDGRRLEIELHGDDWPFAGGRDALLLMLGEEGGAPIATAWTRVDADAISMRLVWIAVRCAAIAPDHGALGS